MILRRQVIHLRLDRETARCIEKRENAKERVIPIYTAAQLMKCGKLAYPRYWVAISMTLRYLSEWTSISEIDRRRRVHTQDDFDRSMGATQKTIKGGNHAL